MKLVQAVQVPYLIQYAKRLGMTGQFNPDLSIALGSGSISLLELTRVYALFPRLGQRLDPIFLNKVIDRDGKVLEENIAKPLDPVSAVPVVSSNESPDGAGKTSESNLRASSLAGSPMNKINFPIYPLAENPTKLLDPRVAYVMSHLMKEVVTFGTGHEAKNLGRPAAGKTGTTNDSIDAWFMGFTPQVVTGVWVGFDGLKSIGPGETGAKVALPIWLNFMREAVKPYPVLDFSVPPGITFVNIDATTGKFSSPNSSTAIREAFIEGTEPLETGVQDENSSDSEDGFFKEDKE